MQLSIVIPSYNEERDIVETLIDIKTYVDKKFKSYEIIVVDDGSTDTTSAKASSVSGVSLIRMPVNQGKGAAVRRGVLASTGDLILFMDADNSTTIRELDHCIPEIADYDMIIGSRAIVGADVRVSQKPIKKFFGRLGNLMIRSILMLPFRDTQCGFKLFRPVVKEIFRTQKLNRWGFDFEVVFLAYKKGLRIYESPVKWVNNFDSKVSPLHYVTSFIELLKVRTWYLFRRY